jgi:hypothetical protein
MTLVITLGLASVGAVNTGDENFSKDTNGRFYVLADKVSVKNMQPAGSTVHCLGMGLQFEP